MNSGHPSVDRRAFTLVELLLAMTIFTIVITSVTAALVTASRALTTGEENLELYQSARAGMNRMVKDLRKSLSPLSIPYEERVPDEEEFVDDPYYNDAFEDDDEGYLQITFRGESKQVEFVIRQETSGEDGPTLDIREVRYRLGDKGIVEKEIYRSLLIARLEDALERKMEERFGVDTFFPQNESKGYFEDPKAIEICEGITELRFEYHDGVEWFDSWSSEDWLVKDYATDWDDQDLTEEDVELSGLPQLVRIEMALENGVVLQTVTDIPASELNVLRPRGEKQTFGGALNASLDSRRRGWERSRRNGGFGRRGAEGAAGGRLPSTFGVTRGVAATGEATRRVSVENREEKLSGNHIQPHMRIRKDVFQRW